MGRPIGKSTLTNTLEKQPWDSADNAASTCVERPHAANSRDFRGTKKAWSANADLNLQRATRLRCLNAEIRWASTQRLKKTMVSAARAIQYRFYISQVTLTVFNVRLDGLASSADAKV